MLKVIAFILFGFVVLGCSAVGVIESSDPDIKIEQAYALMNVGRALPAQRLFKEAIDIAKERKDRYLEARAIVGLGDLYRNAQYGVDKQNLTNYKLSTEKYDEAARVYTEIGFNKGATMAYLGAAWAAAMDGNTQLACGYYKKTAAAFKKPSGGKVDRMSPELDSESKPFSETLAEYKSKDGCK